jgi:hypothetical protein
MASAAGDHPQGLPLSLDMVRAAVSLEVQRLLLLRLQGLRNDVGTFPALTGQATAQRAAVEAAPLAIEHGRYA